MKVSFLIPSLGRPEGLQRCLESIKAQSADCEMEVLVDSREESTVPLKVCAMTADAKGEWLIFGANDCEFDPDCVKEALKCAEETGKRFISFDSGNPNETEHFMIARSLLPLLEDGHIFHPDFWHVGCDNWLRAQCDKLGEHVRCDAAKVIHHHFTRGSEFDWVYQRGWANAEKDREALKKKLEELAKR